MTSTQRLAKAIRVISVPPVMVLMLLLLLYVFRPDVFSGPVSMLVSVALLMVVPVLAYPLAAALPAYRQKGREGQRSLAFVCSVIGYAGAVIYGVCAAVGKQLQLIFCTYFISVLLLLVCNTLLGLRASGHACSVTGPLILMTWFLGWQTILPCVAVFALIVWDSLRLKRHTPKELVWGSVSAALAFCLSLLMLIAF